MIADTGYGNAVNVVRTVQLYEQAGVTDLHLEDQAMPTRCGHRSTVRGATPRLVLYPIGTLLAATAGIRSLLATSRTGGVPRWPGFRPSASSPT
ncbi:hypothetical protein [Geodermatophilus sp. URMC 62]|uniref:hypothetical protein n=1 Tax=Geodermatophilus sp. URMC 62 TaxID=3423414 RepID=UPI00406C0659